jgi:hypothetical protein
MLMILILLMIFSETRDQEQEHEYESPTLTFGKTAAGIPVYKNGVLTLVNS